MRPYVKNGWRSDLEPAAHAALALPRYRAPRESNLVATPRLKTFDPRPFVDVYNQQRMNSCEGHSLTKVLEWIYFLRTGKFIELSRMFAYIKSQERDGSRSDSGATIGAGVWVAQQLGVPLEKYWPYTGQYSRRVPAEAEQHAGEYKLDEAFDVTTAADCRAALGRLDGGIHFGMPWTTGMRDAGGVIEEYSGRSVGGHAVCFLSLSDRVDSAGEHYAWFWNSHSKNWGEGGVAEVSPRCMNQIFGRVRGFGAYYLRGLKLQAPSEASWATAA